MKKKVLALIIVLAVAVSVLALGRSLGWFITGGGDVPYKEQTIDYGDMDYSLVGEYDILPVYKDTTNNIDYAAPGANMIYYRESSQSDWIDNPMTILNRSTIATNLRVKVLYTYVTTAGVPQDDTVYDDTTQDFIVDFADSDNWIYQDSFWYYRPNRPTTTDIPAVAGDQSIVINSMGYSGENIGVGSVYEGKSIKVSLFIEAKQADYATWEQIYEDETP